MVAMSDVGFCRMKINRVDVVRIFDLLFDVGFDVPPGLDPVCTILFPP